MFSIYPTACGALSRWTQARKWRLLRPADRQPLGQNKSRFRGEKTPSRAVSPRPDEMIRISISARFPAVPCRNGTLWGIWGHRKQYRLRGASLRSRTRAPSPPPRPQTRKAQGEPGRSGTGSGGRSRQRRDDPERRVTRRDGPERRTTPARAAGATQRPVPAAARIDTESGL